MDDYKKRAIGWGRKERKQQSRDAKATMRTEVKKLVQEQTNPVEALKQEKFEADEAAKDLENRQIMDKTHDPDCLCPDCLPLDNDNDDTYCCPMCTPNHPDRPQDEDFNGDDEMTIEI